MQPKPVLRFCAAANPKAGAPEPGLVHHNMEWQQAAAARMEAASEAGTVPARAAAFAQSANAAPAHQAAATMVASPALTTRLDSGCLSAALGGPRAHRHGYPHPGQGRTEDKDEQAFG